jgi:EmrB/QacA subfamily drug resistance transporter
MDKRKRIITLSVFLLGIFIGAIDSGIVSPSRTVIQNSFGISENAGIWMITIYTLAYAVAMPIVSKLADNYGRKKVYLLSIITFTFGSVLCGLTNFYGNYGIMLGARVIQAIGGGGIVPIATAFIGQSFPPEKRGTALGFVGGIYGIATILGPTMGSTIIDIAGVDNWGWIFFINVPISLIILALGFGIKENRGEEKGKLDLAGSAALGVVILSLMYALTNLNFFHFQESLKSVKVWPFLIVFILSLPIFMLIEKKAQDPILNIKYFTNFQIAITLVIGFITGCGLMGIVFVPQFAENVLKIKAGSGGYMVTLMSVFAGISAPFGGKLIDRFSAKLVTMAGFTCTAIGTGFMALYVTSHPSFGGMLAGLAFVGLGIGFTMGTPLNYLMLSYVKPSEASSGLAALSLIRSIGVAVSPNILIGFIAQAGTKVQENLMVFVMKLQPGGGGMAGAFKPGQGSAPKISPEVLDKLKSSDVTAITDNVKEFVGSMVGSAVPAGVKEKIFKAIEANRSQLENLFQSTMNEGFRNMFIAAAIIAVAGLVLALLLKSRKVQVENYNKQSL